jgi:hypothetical protein
VPCDRYHLRHVSLLWIPSRVLLLHGFRENRAMKNQSLGEEVAESLFKSTTLAVQVVAKNEQARVVF